jgi:hypothetical protein
MAGMREKSEDKILSNRARMDVNIQEQIKVQVRAARL